MRPRRRPLPLVLTLVLLWALCGARAQAPAAVVVAASAAPASLTLAPLQATPLPPPAAEKRPFVVKSPFGQRSDDYHWLRDDGAAAKRPEVLRHLEAENRHTEAVLGPLRALRERLYQEMATRVKADESSVPVYERGWWIWRQYEAGIEHPKLMRRRGGPEGPDPTARAELLLDLPQQAIAQRYYAFGQFQLSPDGQWLAWTEDVLGRGSYDVYIQHLPTRRLLPERIRGVLEALVWGGDNRSLFYVRQDPVTLRGGQVVRHQRGSDPAADALVHDEADKTLFIELRASASREWVLIDLYGSDSAELRAVPAATPEQAPKLIIARRQGVKLHADHIGGRWLLRTNEGAPNFRLVAAPAEAPDKRSEWRTLMGGPSGGPGGGASTGGDDPVLEGIEVFEQAIAVEVRVNGRRQVRVIDRDGKLLRSVDGGEGTSVSLGENRDAAAGAVQVVLQSLVQPPATFDIQFAPPGSAREVLRRQELVKGHDPSLYRTQQIRVAARDQVRVPVTLAWRVDRFKRDGSAPLVIEVYGAYGDAYEPEFSAHRLSLLERGFVVAIAHVRGGGELGRDWYEAGRLLNKKRSIEDFIDVSEHLVAERWAAGDKLFAQGASAGGLLAGAAANLAGARFRGIALDVPFVDVLTSMLDASLPLTANEWGEWGDPREKPAYDYLLSYSPYDNIGAREYPPMLVTTALWDTRVPFHEPAKYVARLREKKTDRHPVLLHVEMNAGHAGAAGRYERPRHWARQYAFFLDLVGLAQSAPVQTAGERLIPENVTRGFKLTR